MKGTENMRNTVARLFWLSFHIEPVKYDFFSLYFISFELPFMNGSYINSSFLGSQCRAYTVGLQIDFEKLNCERSDIALKFLSNKIDVLRCMMPKEL